MRKRDGLEEEEGWEKRGVLELGTRAAAPARRNVRPELPRHRSRFD